MPKEGGFSETQTTYTNDRQTQKDTDSRRGPKRERRGA